MVDKKEEKKSRLYLDLDNKRFDHTSNTDHNDNQLWRLEKVTKVPGIYSLRHFKNECRHKYYPSETPEKYLQDFEENKDLQKDLEITSVSKRLLINFAIVWLNWKRP